jgi:hypothetical protein
MRIMKNRSNIIVALILIALVSSLAFGQGGAPSQAANHEGRSHQRQSAVNKEVLKVKLPRAEEATLKNGLQVILLPAHKVPTFNMQLVVLSGGLSDKPDYRGLASFTATLLREGTTSARAKTSRNRSMRSARPRRKLRSLDDDERGQHERPGREPGPDTRLVCRRHSQSDVPAG